MRAALTSHDMGLVVRTFRQHPYHGTDIPQEVAAGWFNISQSRLSRIERGGQSFTLAKLTYWADVLGIPADLLWFKVPDTSQQLSVRLEAQEVAWQPNVQTLPVVAMASSGQTNTDELDDMNRRELLRLLSITGTLLAVPPSEHNLDLDRLTYGADRTAAPDLTTIEEYGQLNAHLWQVFALSKQKRTVFPLVRQQLGVLTDSLTRPCGATIRRKLHLLTGDLFQLAGEIFFDGNRYADAAHCYTMAALASKEADAFDLWACAMTRHAFIEVYERQFAKAAPMLELAGRLAQRGDSSLSTRHWVAVVQAETLAGLGDLGACQRALDVAEEVHNLTGRIHPGGWLRFDGSRLAEERGNCYVRLKRPDLAEAVLTTALRQNISARRRGSVLTDLAKSGGQRGDMQQLVTYTTAAIDMAKQTNSGYVSRKLAELQPHLRPWLANPQVRGLRQEIATLPSTATI